MGTRGETPAPRAGGVIPDRLKSGQSGSANIATVGLAPAPFAAISRPGLGPRCERDLDLLAGLGRPLVAGALVRDPVLVADPSQAERLVRPGEVAGGMVQVGVLVGDLGPGDGAQGGQAPGQRPVVRRAE